ncbi:hypothetical protein RZO07_19370 [Pseudomonas protegens]|uniref:hypothetical protein n=1 Tax=Pseudomonas protegens TaxID=380021 RepID=UPI00293735C8|nr:hypothetical protein [Pseudomonas protegens]WOE77473.1 hypothetical protein RZO07_19370 [Pseudomonas protegens]
MNSYFECVNDWGAVQISDSFSNYVLYKKGRVYSSAGPASRMQQWDFKVSLPPSGARAIIVFDPPIGSGILSMFQKLEGMNQWIRAYSSNCYDLGQELTYYVFIPSDDPAITLEPAKGLFCIWNAEGKLIYDSDAPYLKILEYREHYYGEAQYRREYPNSKRIGFVVSQAQWYVDSGMGPGGGFGNLAGVSAYADPEMPNRVVFDYMLFRRTTVGGQWPSVGTGTNPSKPKMVKMLVCDLTKMDEIPFNL